MDFFIVPLGLLYFLGFLYLSSPTTDFFIIPIHYLVLLSQRISLLFQASRGFFTFSLSQELFYCSSPTTDYLLRLSQRISSLFQSDRILYHSSPKGFVINPVRQKMIHDSYLKGFCLSCQSDNGILIVPLSKDCFYCSSPTMDSL